MTNHSDVLSQQGWRADGLQQEHHHQAEGSPSSGATQATPSKLIFGTPLQHDPGFPSQVNLSAYQVQEADQMPLKSFQPQKALVQSGGGGSSPDSLVHVPEGLEPGPMIGGACLCHLREKDCPSHFTEVETEAR